MSIKYFYTVFLLLAIFFTGSYGQDASKIEGTIKGLGNNTVILAVDKHPYKGIDTVKAINDKFIFKHNFDRSDPTRYLIYFPYIVEDETIKALISRYYGAPPIADKVFFFIDSKNIVINGEITKKNGLVGVTVMGSAVTYEYNKILESGFPSTPGIKKYQGLSGQVDRLNIPFLFGHEMYYATRNKRSYYHEILDSLAVVRRQDLIDAISKNDKSIALAYIAYTTYKDKDPTYTLALKKTLKCFATELKDTYYIRFLREKLSKWETAAIGAPAPDFVLPDSTGTKFRLSSLRGNYVLLDFWPSSGSLEYLRLSIPHVAKAYRQFSQRGFKVLGISSVDADKKQWLETLRYSKTPYVQLFDNKRITKELYQYPSGPYRVLIAPDGTIKQIDDRDLWGSKLLLKMLEILYDDTNHIEGTIKGLGNNEVVLANDLYIPLDTVKAVNDRFTFKYNVDTSGESKFYMIYLPFINEPDDDLYEADYIKDFVGFNINNAVTGKYNPDRTDKVYFFIDSKKIIINGKITKDGLSETTVKGSPLTDQYNALKVSFPVNAGIKKNDKLLRKLKRELTRKMMADKAIDSLQEKITEGYRYRMVLDSLYGIRNQEIIKSIPSHSRSIALACIAYQAFTASGKQALTMLKDASSTFFPLKDAVSKFSQELKDSHYIRLLREKLKEWEVGTSGMVAPDFVLKDSSGRATRLSSLRGNYVLLDFWASFCGGCRAGIPDVIKAYRRFSGKGLTILGISIDNSKDAWLKALKEEKMPYPQLLDKQNITKELYKYNIIPRYVLIAPDGTIVRINKGLKGKELIKTLEALYPN